MGGFEQTFEQFYSIFVIVRIITRMLIFVIKNNNEKRTILKQKVSGWGRGRRREGEALTVELGCLQSVAQNQKRFKPKGSGLDSGGGRGGVGRGGPQN